MSKSLGNFFTIRDVTQQYHPFVLRWFLLSSGYRAPINYTQRGLEEVSSNCIQRKDSGRQDMPKLQAY